MPLEHEMAEPLTGHHFFLHGESARSRHSAFGHQERPALAAHDPGKPAGTVGRLRTARRRTARDPVVLSPERD